MGVTRAPAAALAASLAAALACAPCGCAGARADPTRSDAGPETGSAPLPMRGPGLALERLFVPEDPRTRRDALAAAASEGFAERLACGLDGAGFAVYRVRTEDDLARLIEMLGGSPQRHETLLGMLRDWADCASAPVEAGRSVSLGGRARPMPESTMRLAMRGWCFPTVDSARARIELRVTTEPARPDRAALDRAVGRPRARVVTGTETIVELAPGETLLVVESPIVLPEGGGDGLEALPPPAPAALLLAERAIPGRATLLVVRASFADMLPPSP